MIPTDVFDVEQVQRLFEGLDSLLAQQFAVRGAEKVARSQQR